MKRAMFIWSLAWMLSMSAAQAQVVQVDPDIPAYQQVGGISGNANSIGSDTMNNLMTLWLEGFRKYYPNVRIQVEGKGSSTAPVAMIEGTAQFGPMSRPMKQEEIDRFEARYGYKPLALRVAVDALAVFVHKDNPIQGLTMQQVDAIFSKTRRGGLAENITRWSQTGLTGAWGQGTISMYGRNSASGTYGFFKDHALFGGDYKDEVKEQPGSASVVQGITEDRFAIGYSGIGYRTSGVRVVPLAHRQGEPFADATPEKLADGSYPLGRFLYVYINKSPGRPLDPMVREFCKFIFTQEGQDVVVKDGYIPVPAQVALEEFEKLK